MKKTVCAIVLCSAAVAGAQAQTVTVVASFGGADGSGPQGLIQASDGNFYGTTSQGGSANVGTIFKMTSAGTLSTLYSFGSTPGDGASPRGGVIQASDGNFYGTTSSGGANNQGTIFKITPAGVLTILYSATNAGNGGSTPVGALVQGADGNLYGTMSVAGANGVGTVFKITLSGTFSTLHDFNGGDGGNPSGALVQGTDGNLYGTTPNGGYTGIITCSFDNSKGCGTVFKMTPAGVLTTLYAFAREADGTTPEAGVIQASDGNFYGTTKIGELNGIFGPHPDPDGKIFQITPSGALTYLHGFYGGNNQGAFPLAGLLQAADGNFYGTTSATTDSDQCVTVSGGTGCGTLFSITPGGSFTSLHSFGTGKDGAQPAATLIQAADGTIYGTTLGGGASGNGTIFTFTAAPPDTPAIAASGGVLNGASFQPGISSGAWMTINGTNLSSKTDTWNSSIVNGALPTSLDGVSVMVGDQPAYIEYVSATQINAVAPSVPAGTVPVTVTTSNGTSPAVNVQISAEQPAFFQWGNYVVATRQDFSLAVKKGTFPGTPTVPAKPGDVIILWGTGLGPTSPSAPVGAETPATATYNTATAVSVTVGGKPATVYGAALAPGYAGLYQVAIQIPAALANGDYPVIATIAEASSPATTLITVQQ